ncbi:uncharacterized protein [Paramisgurnus dabryanus]|uniref:uncharacterized protein n=1 Tax=Paramisgurnus dabryanus TaxID=90735 RepID=UPI003CCFB360
MEDFSILSEQLKELSNRLDQVTPRHEASTSSGGAASFEQEPHTATPPTYNGDPNTCRSFLQQCSLVFALQPRRFSSSTSKVAYVLTLLTGRARDWGMAAWGAKAPFTFSFEALEEEMLKLFDRSLKGDMAAAELVRLRQRNDSVTDFAIRFKTLAICCNWNDAALRAQFLEGLTPGIQDEIALREPPTSLEAVIDLALRVESRHRQRDLRRSFRHLMSEPGEIASETPSEEPMQLGKFRISAGERSRRLSNGLCLYCGLTLKGPSGPLVVPLGGSVVLPCSVDSLLPLKDLEVDWKRTDTQTLIHLYQDEDIRPEAQNQYYHDRAHFFTEDIKHGNFSLLLNNLTAEDEGQYTCKVYSGQESGETVVEIKHVERFIVSGSSPSISAYVGEDVTLSCSVNSHIKPEEIEEVSWKKINKDEEILVLLYENNKTLSESSDERYRDRVEFFADEIHRGNFSLRLKRIRTEDKGVYICQVFAGQLSANTTVILDRLGFSGLHILVLILCIAACGSALLFWTLIYCISNNTEFVVNHSSRTCHDLGKSVDLPCFIDPRLLNDSLKVEWRRSDAETLVHLYQDEDIRPEAQHQDYHDRAHFFTEDIKHGNFSLKLKDLREEDKGVYTCTVYSGQRSVFSISTKLILGIFVNLSFAPLGDSVVLPCSISPELLKKKLKVEWRRSDSETLVHLYEDGDIRPKAQHQDYHKRANFFKEKIKNGDFSLQLKKVRAEDKGEYTCKVYCEDDSPLSLNNTLKLGFCVDCTVVSQGGSVLLPCSTNLRFITDSIKAEWRRSDSQTLIHLYQDGDIKPEAQHPDYHDRAHFFTEDIKHGNLSLRLDHIRTEDEGQYTCEVYRGQNSVFSGNTSLTLRLLRGFRNRVNHAVA